MSVSDSRIEQSLEALYGLLPAIHQVRDAQPDGSPGPLRALLRTVAEQVATVSDELDRLYDNAFIETCEDWVVPYIGDLVGHRPLADVPNAVPSPRVDVANTLAYRRRKGTVTVLERLARDVTGWQSVAVEFFRILATAEHLAHVRRAPSFTVNLRDPLGASASGGPFDPNAHLPEVRSIASGRGRYGIPNVGIYAWRLDAKPIGKGEAFQVLPGRFTFDPAGRDLPLLNVRRILADEYSPAKPENLPLAIGRRKLADELTAFNAALLAAGSDAAQQKAARDGLRLLASFTVYDAAAAPIPPEKLQIADLSLWDTHRPAIPAPLVASVDPVLGRIDLGNAVNASTRILVDYAGGFAGPYGAAPYARASVVKPARTIVRSGPASNPSEALQAAVAPALANGTTTPAGELYAILEYEASITERAAQTIVPLAGGQHLTVRAAGGERVVLNGPLQVTVAPGTSTTASLQLEGLLLNGGITVIGTGTLQLVLRSCTVRPPNIAGSAIVWNGPAGGLTLDHSFAGPVAVTAPDPVRVHVTVTDSLVDGHGAAALTAPVLDAFRATFFGPIAVHEIGMLENAIVTGLVTSARTQSGCCRYSYLPRGSHAPHRFRCQPEDAARAASEAAAACDPALDQAALAAIADLAAARCVPVFDALRDDDPAYGRLSIWCPPEVRNGAEDASEMGVYHDLYEPQREANLRARLAEYLGLGLEAGIFYVS